MGKIIDDTKKIEDLHPPKKSMVEIAYQRLEVPEVDKIDDAFFEKIARSSEFRRLIYMLFSGKVHRGSINKLNEDINIKRKQVQLAADVEKLARGSKLDYTNVMKELKEVLSKRKIQ